MPNLVGVCLSFRAFHGGSGCGEGDTLRLVEKFGGQLQARADGAELTQDLADEVKAFCTAALDESVGESYHGRTSQKKLTAPGATLSTLKHSARSTAVLSRLKAGATVGGNQITPEGHVSQGPSGCRCFLLSKSRTYG